MLYNVVLISTVQRDESAVCTYSLCFWTSFPFGSPRSWRIIDAQSCVTSGGQRCESVILIHNMYLFFQILSLYNL